MAKLILFGGKGGVGKTTTSSAVAIWTASQGLNTLVVSSDPAHSVSDSFGQPLGSTPTPIQGIDNLWAMEMDPKQIMNDLAPKLTEALSNPMKSIGIDEDVKMTGDEMVFPGLDEALAFDLLLKFVESHEYDIVIFDTAPTGHTLRFLSLPALIDKWISKVIHFRHHLLKLKSLLSKKKDTGLDILEKFKRRLAHIRRFLSNEKFTSFYIVLIPELLAVEESRRAKMILSEYNIPVKGAVVNHIFPENNACSLCQSRYRIQSKYLKEIEKEFHGYELAKMPIFEKEIQGVDALKLFADEIMGKGQLKIEGRKSLEREYDPKTGLFQVRLFYPEARTADMQLKTKGQLLIVVLHGMRSEIEVPFTVNSSKVTANFEEDYLHITVQE